MMSYHDYPHPVSRTYQYKKITKPLLERKRRARINRCLDELKDLMVDALETEGENISKLEKADILELTVRHLQRLQAIRSSGLSSTICANNNTNGNSNSNINNNEVVAENRWQSGFGHCATEACRFLSSLPGEAAERLARHLAAGLQTNRQTNSSTRSTLLSPTLASLDRVANSVAPIPPALVKASHETTATSDRQVNPKVSSPYPAVNSESSHSDGESNNHAHSPPIVSTSIEEDEESIVMESERINTRDRRARGRSNWVDDEEEIDVERVDDGDPMWRPW